MRISPVSFNNSYSKNNNIRNKTQNNNNSNYNDTFVKSSKVNAQPKNNKNISFGFFDSEIADKIVRQILTAGPADKYRQDSYDYTYKRLKESEYIRIYTGPDKSLHVEYDDVCLVDPFARRYCHYESLPNRASTLQALAIDSAGIKRVLTQPIRKAVYTYDDTPSRRLEETLEALAK